MPRGSAAPAVPCAVRQVGGVLVVGKAAHRRVVMGERHQPVGVVGDARSRAGRARLGHAAPVEREGVAGVLADQQVLRTAHRRLQSVRLAGGPLRLLQLH